MEIAKTAFKLNRFSLYFLIVCSLLAPCLTSGRKKYQPNWKSLDSRPLPAWYDESKFGIFIHWGVFSVPSFGSEWFWWYWKGEKIPQYVQFMKKNYPPSFTYADFASMFKAEFYNPDQWADIFKASGAKYIVLVSKHHEGFCNWPSKHSFNWNSMDVGPNRDLVGDLAQSIRNRTDLHFGLYHSLFEWFNPLFNEDKANQFKTQKFVAEKTMPELYELVNNYKPDVIWSDGSAGPVSYWNSTNFLAWLYNDSPVRDTVVTNDRWGNGASCHHGGFYTCSDRYNPGKLQNHKWENCMTIDRGSWGYRRNVQLSAYLSMDDLTKSLIETVSCGGNLLLNVGPTSDGRIVPIFEERLRQMGSWLKINGEAIYSSKPWTHQNDTLTKGVWYTSKKGEQTTNVYALVLNWPKGDTAGAILSLGAPRPTPSTKVTLLGFPEELKWQYREAGGIDIKIPPIPIDQLPCQWAWTFRLQYLKQAR